MLGGLIAGAIGGAAKGVGEIAEGRIEDERKTNLAKQLADIEIDKTQRIEEWRSELKRNNAVPDAQAAADAADVTDARNIERDAANGKRRAEVNAGNVAEGIKAENAAGLPELKADQNLRVFNAGKPQRDAKFREDVTNLNDPGYLAGKHAEAKATHFESASSAASAAATSWELAQKKQIADMRAQLAKLPKDSPDREALQQRIQDLSGGTAKGDTLAQQVAAARAVLNDMDSSDEEKEAARKFLGTVVTNATSARGGGSTYPAPSQSHVDALRKNPNMAKDFDKKFGPGAAQKYMNDR